MTTAPSASMLCVAALGMIAGLVPSLDWRPGTVTLETPMRLPAASQYLVGAEARRADTVLSGHTTESEAPEVDGWLRRLPPGGREGALRLILNHPAPMLRQRWLRVLFVQWTAASRPEALRAALAVGSPSLRLAALDAVLESWGERDARGAMTYALTLTDPMQQSYVMARLLERLAQSEPEVGVAWAVALKDPFQRSKALEQVAKARVLRDPLACLKWGRRVEDASERRVILGFAVAHLSQREPMRAFDAAMEEPDTVSRRELLTVAFQNVSFAHLPTALTWLRTHQAKLDVTLQPALRVLGATLANDRVQAAQLPLLAGSLRSGPLADSLLAGAAQRLVALGRWMDARRLLAGIGPGIERQSVQDALDQR